MKGTVPIGQGDADIELDKRMIRIRATHGRGILRFKRNGEIEETSIEGNGEWVEVRSG